ncbi:hypothetical protein BDY17DRAFT_291683 [Neohortaea acidophila]|uniref:Tubby C-terminal-like domain-containing protein n=1 Tax=Neohortaea acidophila TaxID=245834 RepID=A0A6A6Q4G4_9PEZI|nr:uncharacterized protein BDY17DRAFT_291683 [Neohortaea acidophila]KAF2486543.1 hypothetical protein BDY17DRAFT_291683 [Neohortaea acidophila]
MDTTPPKYADGLSPPHYAQNIAARAAAQAEPPAKAHQLNILPYIGAYRDVQLFRPGKPLPAYFCTIAHLGGHSLTLQKNSQSGPVVGYAHYRTSGSINCGIGPDERSLQWIPMRAQGECFRFEWQERKYSLRKAQGEDLGLGAVNLHGEHLKVVDEETQGIVALLISEGQSGAANATLKMAGGVKGEAEVLIVLAMLSWRDRIRRAGSLRPGEK